MATPTTQHETTSGVPELVGEILRRHPTVGFAVGLVRDGRLDSFHGNGVADIVSGTGVTEDTIFRIASITKTFTAIAVMQLWERGLVDLDAPANDYLLAYALVPDDPRFPPATLRHLLTHTAGLPELAHPWGALMPDFGESVRSGRPLPSLAEYYGGTLRVGAAPGTRFVYGNHSPATLGQLVEDVTGMPLPNYFRDHLFAPLGMGDTALLPVDRIGPRLATGYEIRGRGVREIAPRDMVTAGAASVSSTPRDMARYLAALLGGGRNDHGTVLRPDTIAMMFAPQYQPDPRIPGLGLAFFRYDLGGHPAVGHQGTLPGFHSQILLAPDDGIAAMAFTNGAHHADFWLPAEVIGLVRRLMGLPAATMPTDVPHHPELWDDLCGWYQLAARLTDVRLRGIIGAGAEVFVRDGLPMMRFLTPIPALARGFALLPDDAADPYVFRIDLFGSGLSTMRVVFGRDAAGAAQRLHLDLMPLTLEKQPAARNPRRWAGGAVGAVAMAAAAVSLRRRWAS